jgi:phage tail sheath protein FI
MPEYLAPGVYVEETSFRSKSIEGVSTTTTGFIGPTRYGPIDLEPEIITSLGEFVRTYGDGQRLAFGDLKADNFMWHAARAFFTEGGKRLYVSRVFRPLDRDAGDGAQDGHATVTRGGVRFRARYPGVYGNFTLRVTIRSGRNILGRVKRGGRLVATLGALSERDVVWIRTDTSSPSLKISDFYVAARDPGQDPPWKFLGAPSSPPVSPEEAFRLSGLPPDATPGQGESVRVVTVTVEVLDPEGNSIGIWPDLPLDPEHRTGGLADSMFELFKAESEFRGLPIEASADSGVSALEVISALFPAADFGDGEALAKGITRELGLAGGNDGQRPGVAEYEGKDDPGLLVKTGLKQFEALEDISIVAAPGCTWNYDASYRDEANAVIQQLIAHAQNMRYRIAVLDSAQGQTISDVRKMRAKLDSKYAALYFPWVKVLDPITRRVISLPPSGFVAGIYARNDINRAVFKAPANEVVNLALGFDILLSKAQQEVLNPEGVNCFRFFEGRGMLVWGARTISSDPEWKYVNLRRYFAYLEHSIDRGTQWAVFEPNGERLWANIRRTVEDFLLNEWQMGAMLGDRPEKAFFVKCDRTTMNQNDLDNGRLVCLVGVVAVKPAEFVIFRIGQWTADHKV